MIFQANGTHNKVGVATRISGKNILQAKKGKKRQRQTLYYDKGDNSSGRHYSYSYALLRSTKIYKAIINRPKVRN